MPFLPLKKNVLVGTKRFISIPNPEEDTVLCECCGKVITERQRRNHRANVEFMKLREELGLPASRSTLVCPPPLSQVDIEEVMYEVDEQKFIYEQGSDSHHPLNGEFSSDDETISEVGSVSNPVDDYEPQSYLDNGIPVFEGASGEEYLGGEDELDDEDSELNVNGAAYTTEDLHFLNDDMQEPRDEFSEKVYMFKKLSGHIFRKAYADFNLTRSCVDEVLKALTSISEDIFGVALFDRSMYYLEKDFSVAWSKSIVRKTLCIECGSAYEMTNFNEQKLCSSQSYERNSLVVCNSPLLERNSDKETFKPQAVLNFIPLEISLSQILKSDFIFDKCEYGIRRIAESTGEELLDIYDGEVFQKHYKEECASYLRGELSYVPLYLMLNCDGFNPFKYRVHSSWCFLLTICNLPRALRNKKEFTILWSVVEEPKGGVDGVLEELVKNLEAVFNGFIVNGKLVRVKVAMTCCDLPASRKLLGFTATNSLVACQFCKYSWPRQNRNEGSDSSSNLSPPNFSGSEYLTHGLKCHIDLVRASEMYKECKTISGREALARVAGFKDSPFLKLSYIDLMDIQTIDIMHLIGLGVIKRMLEMITIPGFARISPDLLLSESQILLLQKYLNFYDAHRPDDVYKISSSFIKHLKMAKAAEFFSILPVLPSLLAVIGCSINLVKIFALLAEIVSIANSGVIDGDDVLNVKNVCKEFMTLYESLFGSLCITINTHLVLHIHEQLKKFGPMNNYHLFCYERINKILSRTPSCNRVTLIEYGMLKRWYCINFYSLHQCGLKFVNNEVYNLLRKRFSIFDKIAIDNLFNAVYSSIGNEKLPEGSCFRGVGKAGVLSTVEIDSIRSIFRDKFGQNIVIPHSFTKYKEFSYGDAVYKSLLSSKTKATLISAQFSELDSHRRTITRVYLARILYFIHLEFNGEDFYLMRVQYFYDRANTRSCWKDEDGRDLYGIKCFKPTKFYSDSRNTVIPINRIYGRYSLIDSNVAVEIDRKLRV